MQMLGADQQWLIRMTNVKNRAEMIGLFSEWMEQSR